MADASTPLNPGTPINPGSPTDPINPITDDTQDLTPNTQSESAQSEPEQTSGEQENADANLNASENDSVSADINSSAEVIEDNQKEEEIELPQVNLSNETSIDAQSNQEQEQEQETIQEQEQVQEQEPSSEEQVPEVANAQDSLNNETSTTAINWQLLTDSWWADPFEGLNIVFDKSSETSAENNASLDTQNNIASEAATPIVAPKEDFVDPFLNPQKQEEANQETNTQADALTMAAGVAAMSDPAATANESTQNPSLESMLTSVDTTPVSDQWADEAKEKKKKILKIASAVVGVLLLLAVSYLVFSTMYPNTTNNLTNSDNTGEKQSWEALSYPNTDSGSDELPSADIDTSTTTDTEDQMPNTDTSGFGNEDELPNTPTDNSMTNTWESTSWSSDDSTSVDPELTKALQTIEEQTSKAKQLLALAKDKNDSASIRSIAAVIKAIKSVKEKLDSKSFTSYSTEIEPELSKNSFTLDQIAATLIGN